MDLLANKNIYRIGCQTGACIDLSGSTRGEATTLSTNNTFAAGIYNVTFSLSGNQRSDTTDTVVVMLGDLTKTITLSGKDPFQTFTLLANVTDEAKLVFAHSGGDYHGLILDDVSVVQSLMRAIAPVPVPASLPLFATGIGGLGLLAWRRQRKSGQLRTASK